MHGFLRKMSSAIPTNGCSIDQPIEYFLRLDTDVHRISDWLGSTLSLSFTGRIECIECGRVTKKSFSQGYCFRCFKQLAQCDLCMVSPERCHFEKGTCRDASFAKDICMQPHIVYLANSSGLKVGITRPGNLPTRWIDQGAVQALPIMTVMSRQQSGFVEVALKQHVSDKTQWQKMLKGEAKCINLEEARDNLMRTAKTDLDPVLHRFGVQAIQPIVDAKVQTLVYPVNEYPEKIVSLNLDKTPEVVGKLNGIKGQYLILEKGVINLRRFTGYEIELSVTDPEDENDKTEQLILL